MLPGTLMDSADRTWSTPSGRCGNRWSGDFEWFERKHEQG